MITTRHLTLVCLTAFSFAGAARGDAPAGKNVATAISVAATGSGATLRIAASEPITDHTAYTSDGDRIVVDIPDVAIGSLPLSVKGAGIISAVVVTEAPLGGTERKQLRLILQRNADADFRVLRRGNELNVVVGPRGSLPELDQPTDMVHTLVVNTRTQEVATTQHPEVPVPSGEAVPLPINTASIGASEPATEIAAAAISEPAAAISEPVQTKISAAPLTVKSPVANRLTNIKWVDGTIRLEANGVLRPSVQLIENPTRMAIDLPGVIERSQTRQLSVTGNDVKGIRVGQFSRGPDVARVVLDLNQTVRYTVRQTAHGAVIEINPRETVAVAVATPPVTNRPEPAPVAANPAVQNVLQAAAAAPSVSSPPALAVLPVFKAAEKPLAPLEVRDIDAATAAKLFDENPINQLPADYRHGLREAADSGSVTLGGGNASGHGNFSSKTLEDPNQRWTGKPISFTFKNADVLDVIRYFHEISHLNFIVHPSVKGEVTVNLENVPWDQAMDIILRNLGLDYIYQGGVVWIAPQSEIIAQQKQFLANQELQKQTEKPITRVRRISYAKAADLQKILAQNVTARATMVVDDRTNSLIISEIPSNFSKLEKLINYLDVAEPQVRIEARVVEANSSFSDTFGMNITGGWLRGNGSTTPDRFPNTTGQFGSLNPGTATAGFLDLIIANHSGSFSLDFFINAQEARGRAKLLSSPSISVENNSSAEIRAGQEFTFTTCNGQTCTITSKEGVLDLKIKPQITSDGNVAMDIDITNDRLDLGSFRSVGGSSSLPVFRRKATTKLKVRDGDTAVIGGVSSVQEGVSQSGVPVLDRIPVLGWLFKNRTRTRSNAELLIFITPKILR